MMAGGVTQPLKWHGGKNYLASNIMSLMPRHLHYVEPFFGGGAVLLNRDPNDGSLWLPPHKGVSEVVNDVNAELTNFWRCIQDPLAFSAMCRTLEATPLSRVEFNDAGNDGHVDKTLRAITFFIRARQSRAGTFKGFTQLTRNRLRRGVNGNVSEWIGAVDCLPEVHARLRPVVIENMDAMDLIEREDTPGTLFYCDPPYLHETRVTRDAYACEMTRDQHIHLLDVLGEIEGHFILSGYHNELYDDAAKKRRGWRCIEVDLPNNAAGGKEKRRMTECLWMNY
jgi:DNA adenine methylase